MPPSVPEADLTTITFANSRRYAALNPNKNSRQEEGGDIGSWVSDADQCIYSVGSRRCLAPALAARGMHAATGMLSADHSLATRQPSETIRQLTLSIATPPGVQFLWSFVLCSLLFKGL